MPFLTQLTGRQFHTLPIWLQEGVSKYILCLYTRVSLGYALRNGIAGMKVGFLPILLDTTKWPANVHLPQQWMSIPVSILSHHHLVLSDFFIFASLLGEKWYLVTVFICYFSDSWWGRASSLTIIKPIYFKTQGISLVVQWLRFWASSAGGSGQPWVEELISHMLPEAAKNKKPQLLGMLKVIVSSNFIEVATESKEHIPIQYLSSTSVHLHPTGKPGLTVMQIKGENA